MKLIKKYWSVSFENNKPTIGWRKYKKINKKIKKQLKKQ